MSQDVEAGILFAFLPPIICCMLFISFNKKIISLTIFLIFIFISQGLNPPFFFIHKNDFIDARDWIKYFDLWNFISEYIYMYILLIFIFLITLFFHGIAFNNTNRNIYEIKLKDNKSISNIYLYIFIYAIAIPLSIFMNMIGVGISTVQPPAIGWKVVGSTVYFRNFIAPLIIFYLYWYSTRSFKPALALVFYSIVVSITSLSKGMVILSLLPLIIASYFDGQKIKIIFWLFLLCTFYSMVTFFRDFIFEENFNILDIIFNADLNNLLSINFFFQRLLSFIYEISDRLYGAQYTLLVNDFYLKNNWQEIINFFLLITNDLPNIIAFDLFGLQPVNDAVVGVNIGYLNILLLFANKNIFIIFILSVVTSIFLLSIEFIAISFLKLNMWIAYPLSFIMVFFLYDGFIEKFYAINALCFLTLFSIKVVNFSKSN